MNMTEKRKDISLRILLALSAAALILYTVPAWVSGLCTAVAVCVVIALAVFKIPDIRCVFLRLKKYPYVNAAVFLTIVAFGFNFYNMWLDSGYILRFMNLLGIDVAAFVICAAVFAGAASYVVAACLAAYLAEGAVVAFEDMAKANHFGAIRKITLSKAFFLLSAIYVVGIFAIIQADFLYQDDAARAFYGYKQWDYFGRFLSTAMASIVHAGDYLIDIAPVPQLLAMVIMALAGVIALAVLFQRTEFSIWEVLAMTPLGLNPYFLECVSFRFDAPYMAVSVLAGIVPLLWYQQKNMQYLLASVLGVLAVCTSYQPATGIFPVFVILIALRMWCSGNSMKDVLLFCVKSVIGYGLGLAYFKLALMRPADAGYVSNSLPPVSELLPNTMENLVGYYKLIVSDFKLLWLFLTGLVAVFFVCRMVVTSRRKKFHALAMTLLAFVLMLMLCFGIYPVLANTLFAPRAMYGFGVLLAFLCAVAVEGRSRVCNRLAVLMLGWVFFVFAFSYGNALDYQKEYTQFRMNLVLEDLNHQQVFLDETPVKVQLSGSIGQAPQIRNMPQNYNMLNRLLPETFAGGGDLYQYQFFCYHDLRNVIWDQSESIPSDLPVVLDTMYHTIYGNEEHYVIHLK